MCIVFALLLLVTVAGTSAGSILTLPVFKLETCDALLSTKLSTSIDANSTSINTYTTETSRDSSTNTVEGDLRDDATSEDARVLQDATGGRLDVVKPVVSCESLLGVDLSHIAEDGGAAAISASEMIHEGHLYCVVEGTLPASTQWQVMLPVRTWTQRYMQIGCGGLCGMIRMQVNAASGSQQVRGGEFALAATDMGGGMDGKVFANNPGRRKSFAYSAQHLTSLVSKTLIQVYYGQNPRYSYFNGCSDGGREGVMEALRYPNDFDGILAGAPAMLFQFQNSLHHGWFDPHELICGAETVASNECLSEAEVKTILKFYNGPVDPVTRRHLTVGSAQFGSELAWEGVFVPRRQHEAVMSAHIALAALKEYCDGSIGECRAAKNDTECYNATIALFQDGCDLGYECIDDLCRVSADPIDGRTCHIICSAGKFCENGTTECRGPKYEGECFNLATGLFEDGCEEGFFCSFNKCVDVSLEDDDSGESSLEDNSVGESSLEDNSVGDSSVGENSLEDDSVGENNHEGDD
ncbi:Hypothetical protein PHPALM_3951 [Phytophthora palmivora]|uniref:feruloyl esterase n=1 Tax=Phytophthora palmivora TaxID=4796 RepID=A0A2P4YL41_9STRA|nr:Hypothetical protein PHPALM_3951 [Phytophthora palmivora]